MEFLYKHWPKSGVVAFAFIILLLILNSKAEIGSYTWLFWLHLPILMVHQFEEYLFPGGFKEHVNRKVFPGGSDFPLSDKMSCIINVGGWGLFTAAALVGTRVIWFPVMIVLFNGGNALFHSLMAIRHRGYNPGLLSSLFLILPFTVFVTFTVIDANLISKGEIIVSIVGGFILIASLPLTIGANFRRPQGRSK